MELWKLYLVLLSQIVATKCYPLHFPLLKPMHGTMQQQQLAIQEQMFALQQFQALQALNVIPSVNTINNQPLLVIVPNFQINKQVGEVHKVNHLKNRPIEDEERDAIVIDAPDNEDKNDDSDENKPVRAFLLMPNARFSIGGIISQIPFLPIEINVPDTISWIYNGISSIISGWRPQSENQNPDMKSIWKMKNRKDVPVLVMPLGNSFTM